MFHEQSPVRSDVFQIETAWCGHHGTDGARQGRGNNTAARSFTPPIGKVAPLEIYSTQARVVRTIDFAHAAGAKRRRDLVRAKPGSGGQMHMLCAEYDTSPVRPEGEAIAVTGGGAI